MEKLSSRSEYVAAVLFGCWKLSWPSSCAFFLGYVHTPLYRFALAIAVIAALEAVYFLRVCDQTARSWYLLMCGPVLFILFAFPLARPYDVGWEYVVRHGCGQNSVHTPLYRFALAIAVIAALEAVYFLRVYDQTPKS